MSDSWILTEMPCMARTPAPWCVATINDSYAVSTPEDEHGLRTCVCVIAGVQCPCSLAAAHLIAAAPELLAGLKAALDSILELAQYEEAAQDMAKTGWFDNAAKAIAKADGRHHANT